MKIFGSSVFLPYNDQVGAITGDFIEFEVVGVNHHTSQCVNKDITNTITLMSKHVLRSFPFDAAEPENPISDIANNGNNRWAVSNVRQWLNSDAPSGEWYDENWAKKLGHEYDSPPSSTFLEAAGFLAGFPKDLVYHFAKIKNQNSLNNSLGGGIEITNDYVFLPSEYELNYGTSNYDGIPLSYRFTDDASRIIDDISYCTRTFSSGVSAVRVIQSTGTSIGSACLYQKNIIPVIVLY